MIKMNKILKYLCALSRHVLFESLTEINKHLY